MIEWCNTNQGFAMVLLTFVYVIATILICIFNYKSTKATNLQTEENKRQFEETNRAYVNVTFQILKNGLYTLCIENNGNKIAKNVNVDINESFIKNLKDNLAIQSINNLKKSYYTVGIGQKFYIFIGTVVNIEELCIETLNVNIKYEDCNRKYFEQNIIDFNQYKWMLANTSEIVDIRKNLEKIAVSIKNIENKKI